MTVAIEIPDEEAASLQAQFGDLNRKGLEMFAVEGCKAGRLTSHQVGKLLGHQSRWETDGFLKKHEVWLSITAEDVAKEVSEAKTLLGL